MTITNLIVLSPSILSDAFLTSIHPTMNFSAANSVILFGLPDNPFGSFEPFIVTISWEAVYLAGSFVIGLLITYEAIALKRNKGKLPNTLLFNLGSILETIWFMVSASVLYFAHFSLLPKTVAVAYFIYSMFGWAYSFYLLKDEDIDIKDIEDVAMPAKYMDYSLSFAVVIMLTSVAFITYLFMQGKFYFS